MRKTSNVYVDNGDGTTTMKINSAKNGEFDVLIDTINVEKCKNHTWSVNRIQVKNWNTRHYYYVCNAKVGMLHRYLMDYPPKEMIVDHKDGNPINNLMSNLQLCTRQENGRKSMMHLDNTSGVLGVSWNDVVGKWQAGISIRRKYKNLGYFSDINEADKARKEAEKKYFGDFIPISRENKKQ